MQKINVIVIFVFVCFLLSSCSNISEQKESYTIPSLDAELNIHLALDIAPETDYSNIVACTESEKYSKTTDIIKVTVIDQNVGKGFYMYSEPLLQKQQNDEWVTVEHSLFDTAQWVFIGEEGNINECNYTIIPFATNEVKDKLSIGKYRFVIFTKDKELFAEFEVY